MTTVIASVAGSNGKCPDCGGIGLMFSRQIVSGPYPAPPGGKVTIAWLDLPDGSGWYVVETTSIPCGLCAAGARSRGEMIEALLNASGLTDDERNYSLEFYRALGQVSGKERAINAISSMMSNLPATSSVLTLYGPPGVGKSGLGKTLVAAAAKMLVHARYITVRGVIQSVRADMSNNITTELAYIPLLVLDEVDKLGTSFEEQTVFGLIDERVRRRSNQLTVFISNETPQQMSSAGKAHLVSRFSHGEMVAVGGVDLRPLLK